MGNKSWHESIVNYNQLSDDTKLAIRLAESYPLTVLEIYSAMMGVREEYRKLELIEEAVRLSLAKHSNLSWEIIEAARRYKINDQETYQVQSYGKTITVTSEMLMDQDACTSHGIINCQTMHCCMVRLGKSLRDLKCAILKEIVKIFK